MEVRFHGFVTCQKMRFFDFSENPKFSIWDQFKCQNQLKIWIPHQKIHRSVLSNRFWVPGESRNRGVEHQNFHNFWSPCQHFHVIMRLCHVNIGLNSWHAFKMEESASHPTSCGARVPQGIRDINGSPHESPCCISWHDEKSDFSIFMKIQKFRCHIESEVNTD